MNLNISALIQSNISVVPYTTSLLSEKYPKVPNLISALYLLAVNKLKPNLFEIRAVPEDYYEYLIDQTNCRTDFIGDIFSCVLLNVNSLVALGTSSKCWIKLSKYDSKINSDRISISSDSSVLDQKPEQPNLKITMPEVPGLVTKSKTKEDDSSDFLLVQCLAVTSMPKDFVLYTTESVFFNIAQKLNLTVSNNLSSQLQCERIEIENYPYIAEQAVVALVCSPDDIESEDIDLILRQYFMNPRLLRKDDLFSVNLKKYASYLTYAAAYLEVPEVTFKVCFHFPRFSKMNSN